jgi:hypothetical protein
VNIAYPGAVSYAIVKEGSIVEMNQWSDLYRNYGPIRGDFCGENRYTATTNTLEFHIKTGCSLHIEPRDAIQTNVRMEWTLNDFYMNGGTTTFVDRLAAVLGIHVSSMKVVGVYEGSLVVDYNIYQATASDSTNSTFLQDVQKR